MAVQRTLGEGPTFVEQSRRAQALSRRLEEANWDFRTVPEVYAKDSQADVVAKELVLVHDGETMSWNGRLTMGGVGHTFNLMGAIPANSRIRVTDSSLVDTVNRHFKGEGMAELEIFQKHGKPQPVEFFNYGMFFHLRDLVFWLLVHDSGCFPSSLEHIQRELAAGKVVQNYMYAPGQPSRNGEPVLMQATCMSVQFPSRFVQWMERPLFGGFSRETQHLETLLTTEPADVSHPYLEPVGEGKVEVEGRTYYARRFAGTESKLAVRGPGVPPEGPAQAS